MKSEVYTGKVDTPVDLLAYIVGAAVCTKKKFEVNSDEPHTIFAHGLQSALRLTVGFSNIYCEL